MPDNIANTASNLSWWITVIAATPGSGSTSISVNGGGLSRLTWTCLWNREHWIQKFTQPKSSRLPRGPAPPSWRRLCSSRRLVNSDAPSGEPKVMVAHPPRHRHKSRRLCVPSFIAPHLQVAPDPDSISMVSIFCSRSEPARFWKNFQIVDSSLSTVGSSEMQTALEKCLRFFTWTCLSRIAAPLRCGAALASSSAMLRERELCWWFTTTQVKGIVVITG